MIEIKDVSKTYQAGDTAVKALRGVSLSVGKKEFLAIAGPSGSGKTTLLNIVGCIDGADAGDVSIAGESVINMTQDQKADFRRDNLGFIFQTYNLIPVLTAFENVAFSLQLQGVGEKETQERTLSILKEVGLEGMEYRRPSKLSGGQQQRVAIARALVKRPAIILADEPTANLDSRTGKEILDLMKELNNHHRTTFLFATHDPMVMDCANRLVELHDGLIQNDERR